MRDDVKHCAEWTTQADLALLNFTNIVPFTNQRRDPPPVEIP